MQIERKSTISRNDQRLLVFLLFVLLVVVVVVVPILVAVVVVVHLIPRRVLARTRAIRAAEKPWGRDAGVGGARSDATGPPEMLRGSTARDLWPPVVLAMAREDEEGGGVRANGARERLCASRVA